MLFFKVDFGTVLRRFSLISSSVKLSNLFLFSTIVGNYRNQGHYLKQRSLFAEMHQSCERCDKCLVKQ